MLRISDIRQDENNAPVKGRRGLQFALFVETVFNHRLFNIVFIHFNLRQQT